MFLQCVMSEHHSSEDSGSGSLATLRIKIPVHTKFVTDLAFVRYQTSAKWSLNLKDLTNDTCTS